MLRIERATKSLTAIPRIRITDAGLWERAIQDMICAAPGSFCSEISETIWLVGSEVLPTDFVDDRIDLLGVDADGAAVIVEIKRGSHKLQLLQALTYAGMVAKWEPSRFVLELHRFNQRWGSDLSARSQSLEDSRSELEASLDGEDLTAINRSQRIVLLAEDFDYEVLVTAEWLTDHYDMDIRCYRASLSRDGQTDYLTFTRAYPPPELTDIAKRRRTLRVTGAPESVDWDAAVATIENVAVGEFFRAELATGRSSNAKFKVLRYPLGGRIRYRLYAKKKWARGYQYGRFLNDIAFWRSRLSDGDGVAETKGGQNLRLYLTDKDDFDAFAKAVAGELTSMHFEGVAAHDDDDQISD